ncbi:MAG TPA: phospholipase A [Zoogloea sp.]|uniref:phospholipase A n=2 Tax=Zoogloea sp. TaxID=49181 RepID=UPI002B8F8CCA|nr:phospholipase A [Zoogloea sp.]HNI47316.1 phospholipase A [Zoogloea sp.]
MRPHPLALRLILPCALTGTAHATDVTTCTGIADDRARLACYDAAAGRKADDAPASTAASAPAPATAPVATTGALPPDPHPQDAFGLPRREWGDDPLSSRWELEADDKHGTFLFRPYKPSYILPVRWSDARNPTPTSPRLGTAATSGTLDSVEAKYQLSFKTKLWEGLFGRHGDLWLGYTQQSSWQVYNKGNSSPFRETDYEPELMAVFRTNRDLGAGFRLRLLSIGLNHQSNGRAGDLSRSWNRVMAQAGVERGDFSLIVRPWVRLHENAGNDDNADITHYLGHGDVQAVWRFSQQTLGLNLRGNPTAGRGSAGVDWSFPIHRNLKGYLQVFSGYGETLIDYNHRQNVIGFGVSLVDWM